MIYRKRGTEVDAFQWDGALCTVDPEWFKGLVMLGRIRRESPGAVARLYLDPPSGKGAPLVANVGDWIVRNGRGQVFKLSPDEFSETYEPTGQADVAAAIARGDWSPRHGLNAP